MAAPCWPGFRPGLVTGRIAPPVRSRRSQVSTTTGTSPKLALLVYRTLKDGLVYRDPGTEAYDAQHRTHVIRRLRQRAEHLGFVLVNRETGEVAEGAVS